MSYTKTKQKTLQALRSRLKDERQRYAHYKNLLEVYYPNEWKVVGEAIKVMALYYHGEIVRLKHDMADYMKGLDIPEDEMYGQDPQVTKLVEAIQGLPIMLEGATQATAEYDRLQNNPIESADARLKYEEAVLAAQEKVKLIVDQTKVVEGISYGER